MVQSTAMLPVVAAETKNDPLGKSTACSVVAPALITMPEAMALVDTFTPLTSTSVALRLKVPGARFGRVAAKAEQAVRVALPTATALASNSCKTSALAWLLLHRVGSALPSSVKSTTSVPKFVSLYARLLADAGRWSAYRAHLESVGGATPA